MEDLKQIVERYLAAFNETNAGHRRELVDALYTSDSTYTDPQVDLRGPAQIDGFIAQTQEHFPGFTFQLGGPVDAHHKQARFQWHAGPEDAPDQFVGFDVIATEDGRIRSVYGFMDAAPPV
jgi:methylaspartate ammonia-lyase